MRREFFGSLSFRLSCVECTARGGTTFPPSPYNKTPVKIMIAIAR